MNKIHKHIIVTAFIILLIWIIVFNMCRSHYIIPSVVQTGDNQSEYYINTNVEKPKTNGLSENSGSNNERPWNISKIPWLSFITGETKRKRWKLIAEEKNVSVGFWGRIVDEKENAIPGARVVLHIRHWSLDNRLGLTSAFPTREMLTDSDGRFEWTSETGDCLTLETVEKDGYRLSPQAPKSFHYGPSPEPFKADPKHPVIIRMWRLKPVEPVIAYESFFGFIPDGRFYTLDLVRNEKHEGVAVAGDITIRIRRPEQLKPRDRYSWSLETAAIEGGLLEAQDEFLFEAPESGYVPRLVFDQNPASTNWTSVLRKRLYLMSRKGQVYGAITLTVRPDYSQKAAIQIDSVINTNRSRNLVK